MTTTATPDEPMSLQAQLDRALARVLGDEPTITDVSAVLHIIGTHAVDPDRMQAYCLLAARALGKFDAWTRYAPPAALKDIVAEALQVCEGPSCDESVAPWDGDVFCSDYCRNEFRRAMGETA